MTLLSDEDLLRQAQPAGLLSDDDLLKQAQPGLLERAGSAVSSGWDMVQEHVLDLAAMGQDLAKGAGQGLLHHAAWAMETIPNPANVILRTVDELAGTSLAPPLDTTGGMKLRESAARIPGSEQWRPELKGPAMSTPGMRLVGDPREHIRSGAKGAVETGLSALEMLAVTPVGGLAVKSKLIQNFTKEIAKNPRQWVKIEAELGAASGVGGQIGADISEGSDMGRVMGEVGGALTYGPIRGTMAALNTTLKAKYGAMDPELRQVIASNEARRWAADPGRAAQELADGERLANRIGAGHVLPTGDLSQDPGLIALQTHVMSENAQLMGRIIQDREAAQLGLDAAKRKALGASDVQLHEDPAAVAERLSTVGRDLENALAGRIRVVQENYWKLVDDVTLGVGPEAQQRASAVLAGELRTAEREARIVEKQLWQKVDPNGQIPMPGDGIAAWVDEVAQNYRPDKVDPKSIPHNIYNAMRRLTGAGNELDGVDPLDISSIPTDFNPALFADDSPVPPFTLRDLTSIRSWIQAELRDTADSTRLRPSARAKLIDLSQRILATIDAGPSNADPLVGDPGIKAAYDTARSYTRALHDKFTRGVSGDVLRELNDGGLAVPPEGVAAAYFVKAQPGPGGGSSRAAAKAAADQFVEALGSRPAALDAAQTYLRGELRALTGPDGNIKPEHFDKFLSQYQAALNPFPELRGQFSRLGAARRSVLGEEVKAQADLKDWQRSVAKLYINEDPDNAAAKILNSSSGVKQAQTIARLVEGDPAAKAGFRRSLFKEAMSKVQSNPKAYTQFLNEREGVLKAAGYSQDDINVLRDLNNYGQRIGKYTPRFADASTQAIVLDNAPTLSTLLSRIFAVQRGVVSTRFVASDLVLRTINKILNSKTQEALIGIQEQLVTDPAFARLALSTPAQDPTVTRNLRNYLIATGLVSAQEYSMAEDQERGGQ